MIAPQIALLLQLEDVVVDVSADGARVKVPLSFVRTVLLVRF